MSSYFPSALNGSSCSLTQPREPRNSKQGCYSKCFSRSGFTAFGLKLLQNLQSKETYSVVSWTNHQVRVSFYAQRYLVFRGNFIKAIIRPIYHNSNPRRMSEGLSCDFRAVSSKILAHRVGGGLLKCFGGDGALWALVNAMNLRICSHVYSHKITGSMNSRSPSLGSPGGPWTPVSCFKIYICGTLSKVLLNKKKKCKQAVYRAQCFLAFQCCPEMNIYYLKNKSRDYLLSYIYCFKIFKNFKQF